MSSHRTPGVYEPDTLKVMSDAFDRAWSAFKPKPENAELSRLLMARAIIEAVEAGAIEASVLVDKATRALTAALGEDGEAIVVVGARRVRKSGPPPAFSLPRSASPWSANAA